MNMGNLRNFSFGLFCIIPMLALFFGFSAQKQHDANYPIMDVGIVVSDLEKSVEFYTKVIGMKVVDTFHLSPQISKSAGFTDGKAIKIYDLKLVDKPNAPQYKLAKIQGVVSEALAHSFKPGLRYITIKVHDVKPYLDRIKQYNIQLWGEGPLDLREHGISVLILEDPDGAMIEIMGPLRK